MKRIVIIEGNVSSLSRAGDEYEARVASDRNEVVFDVTPATADQIGASFREPMRIVVEIGTEDVAVGSLAGATRDELIHALAAARHAADEYRRECEALAKSNEGLRADLDTMRAKNNEMHRTLAAIPVAFDPEKHITKATVCAWLERDADLNCMNGANGANGANLDEEARFAYEACAADTRAIIARINTTKESP